jgi:6-pyruvoyltetrahydropterin/6-carboxytetrahydropterin synthase
MFEISVEDTFAAGHALRNYHGKCENVHGHNYKVVVTVEGEHLNAAGLLMDFADLKRLLHGVMDRLDHKFLNEMEPFDEISPTAENMSKFFYDELSRGLPADVRLASVKIWETDASAAVYRP